MYKIYDILLNRYIALILFWLSSSFKFSFLVIDCQVSDWSDWSKCDVACGIGTSSRTREVIRPESNGGVQCPSLEESRSCRATRCSTRQLDKISALKGNKKY